MFGFKDIAKNELMLMENLLALLSKTGEKPKGHVTKINNSNDASYALRFREKDPNGIVKQKYISLGKSNSEKAHLVKKKFYSFELEKRLRTNIKLLEHLVESFQPYDYESINNSFNKALREIMFTGALHHQLSRNQLEEWANAPYETLQKEKMKTHYSLRGEQFRSKSEVIIADALTSYKIPYRYDVKLELKDASGYKVTRYPDFAIQTPTRKMIYWEHLGMLNRDDYTKTTGEKLQLYALNGIIPGRNLIISAESSEGEVDARDIAELIEALVLKHF